MGSGGGVVSPEERTECLNLIKEAVDSGARKVKACEILNLNLRTIERWENNLVDGRSGPLNRPANALTNEERALILATVNSSQFANLPPCQIVPKLADMGKYIASESSIYRILREEKLLAHRSRSNAKKHSKPDSLIALEPNQIWSWDITYLKAGIKGTYFYLYLPMDIFSRKIVHWEVHEQENSQLAAGMISKACELNKINEGQVVLHSDNGGPMKGATMLATLQRLGVACSFSRPRVSDDNPFSEALFKTLKYCPLYPEKGFSNLDDARKWVEKFVNWYNNIHLHSGINFVTPATRHSGLDVEILKNRDEIYLAAKIKNPTRWSGKTRNWLRPAFVELNPGREVKKIENQKVA